MLRFILIFLPVLAPPLLYILYRWWRYRLVDQPPPPIPLIKLLAIGMVLVVLNIFFLVQFNATPAAETGYHYPEYNHGQPE